MNQPRINFDVTELVARLAGVEHFRRLSPEQVQAVIALGSIHAFPRDAVIFVENDPGTGLYVLLSGQVHLTKLSADGQIAILAVFDPVIMFNEVSALDRGPAPATAIASEDTVVWRLDPEHLEQMIINYPGIGLGLLRVLASRNRKLVGHFEDLSFRTVLSRAAKLLLELSKNGTKTIDRRKFPNHQMAARIATIPEAFSRSLKVFKTNGDIDCNFHAIQLLKPEHIAMIAQLGPWEEESI